MNRARCNYSMDVTLAGLNFIEAKTNVFCIIFSNNFTQAFLLCQTVRGGSVVIAGVV